MRMPPATGRLPLSRAIARAVRVAGIALVAVVCGAAQEATVKVSEIPMIGITGEGITCVIGGALGDRFVGGDLIHSRITPRQEYTLHNVERGAGDVVWTIGKPKAMGGDGDCEEHHQQELSLITKQLGKPQVAIFGSQASVKTRLPAKVEMLATDDKDAVAMVAAFLKEKGFGERPARIEQAMRVDLDGDGAPELLVNALDTERGNAKRGDYSLILARVGKGADARTVALSEDITPEDTEYPSVLWENTIVAVVDLDRDGASEIVLYGEFFHGDGWDVVRLKDGKAEHVTFCGCGG